MKEIEILFIDHCEPACGLGSAEFTCPFCNKWIIDYGDVWYNFGEYTLEKEAKFTCEKCKNEGIIFNQEDKYFLKSII